jgi:energy-coupling factor transporter transmembrane protein EcfT
MPHPVVRLLVWGVAAVVAQLAAGPSLALLVLVSAGTASVFARLRFWRLLRRTRWLLLAIFSLFAWATPGVLLLPDIAAISPTIDGLILGATHLGRLVIVLASLAVLLQVTPSEELVGAFFSLLAPLGPFGVDRGRIAVRLLLVIEYVESAEPHTWRDWLEPSVASNTRSTIVLRQEPLSACDGVTLFLALVLGGLFACAP